MRFSFRLGRGTIDVCFVLIQIHEKNLEGQKTLYDAFVDHERAYDKYQENWYGAREVGVDHTVQTLESEHRTATELAMR